MSADPFAPPASGGKITNYAGALLLITPTDYLENISTTFGESDAVEANVVVLDKPTNGWPDEDEPSEAGHVEKDGLRIFQGVLISQTKARIGKGMVLGRLVQRAPTKPGHSGAWALDDPTEEDKQAARDYLATKDPFS